MRALTARHVRRRFLINGAFNRYYRKAKAQQLLSQTSDAIDTLTSALSKANLAGERGLNDALVEVYGGFLADGAHLMSPLRMSTMADELALGG